MPNENSNSKSRSNKKTVPKSTLNDMENSNYESASGANNVSGTNGDLEMLDNELEEL
jgi:hypothetical protein